MYGSHLEECDLLRTNDKPEQKPTHYNEYWTSEFCNDFTDQKLKEMTEFNNKILEKVVDAERVGLFIPTLAKKQFTWINGEAFPPESNDWKGNPVYYLARPENRNLEKTEKGVLSQSAPSKQSQPRNLYNNVLVLESQASLPLDQIEAASHQKAECADKENHNSNSSSKDPDK